MALSLGLSKTDARKAPEIETVECRRDIFASLRAQLRLWLSWGAQVETAESGLKFDQGERIFHQKFGYGKITSIDGNKLEVEFEKAGTKKVVDSFVERTK